ncbi:MAG: hypothetical protein MSH41_04365, partial [Bacteroidales bacterium]|nr:hypothetical protein [Bacteroidales bacterium]
SGSHPSPAAFAFFNKKRDLFASPFPFIICGKRGILSPLRFESDFVDDEPPSGSHPSPAAFAFFQ